MAHAIHSVHGMLIDDRPFGESGRILYILSGEHGIVTLLAQGVREQKSKLRGLLSLATVGNFEFVEGKEVKRIITILPVKKYEKVFHSVAKRNVFSRVVNFLERVVVGEGENEELYTRFIEGVEMLEHFTNLDIKDAQRLEIAIIINLLEALGYWNGEEYIGYTGEVLSKIEMNKDYLIKEINKAIESTHL